jgi:hypothetical protein
MRARDTSLKAHQLQVSLYRAMTAAQRSELALRMSDDVRRIAAEGIQQRHPEYSEFDVRPALGGAPVRSRRGRQGVAGGAGASAVSGAGAFLARVVGVLDQASVPYMLAGSLR